MRSVPRCLRAATSRRQMFALPLLCLIFGILVVTPSSATTFSGEIIQSSVSATVSSTYDPVNGYSVTFQWQTNHKGNSIVVIENDQDYAGNDNSSSRQIVQNDYTTNHVVVVDHFPAYAQFPTYGYYVASHVGVGRCNALNAECTADASYPGPPNPSCGPLPLPACYLSFNLPYTAPPSGPLAFTMWPVGGTNVYQGDSTQSPACSPTAKSSRECNDLYVAMQANQMSGPLGAVVQMLNPVITNLDTGKIVTNNTVTVQYLCGLDAPSNPPPQGWDGDYFADEACSNASVYSSNSTLRIRVNSQAVPGHYQFTGSFQGELNGNNAGNPVNVTYNFTILPAASFTATPPTSFPAIPGLSTWQTNMINPTTPASSGEFWCTNIVDTNPWWSLDNGNFSGFFDIPASIYFQAWNYDGGRVYQQIGDYQYYVLGTDNRAHWKRCAQLAFEPYKDDTIGTKAGFVTEPNQFPYGLAMNFLRTGDTTDQQAVNYLATNQAYLLYYSGSVYPESSRVSAYMMDDRLAAEIDGAHRVVPFMLRGVDVMLGYLDQSYNLSLSNPNQQEYNIHPFLIGLAMESLITYYELDVAEGNTPDARIPLEIKKVLDWWEATQYVKKTHTLAYGAYDYPANPALVPGTLFDATELNDLVATAWAWYWYKTGNSTYLNQGDDLFLHVWDSASGQNSGGGTGWTYSVKEFNQVYKWSFDYVRWRSGQNPDGSMPPVETILPATNPCDNQTSPCNAPWTDYTTPVQFEWVAGAGGNQPTINPTLTPPVVSSTTANFWLSVFKPNTTMQVWYGTTNPTPCNPQDPQSPYCMQPFPNFGFLTMLQDNYANKSQVATCFQDQTAKGLGINNIYDCTVSLTGLTPNTTYFWQTLTTDSLGNMAVYNPIAFTTLQ